MNVMREALHAQCFVCVLEWVADSAFACHSALNDLLKNQSLADWPLIAAFADRVGDETGLPPIDAFKKSGITAPSLIHFSGKDRHPEDLLTQVEHMQSAGLSDVLVLTGDRKRGHIPGEKPIRYLESVPALHLLRQRQPDLYLGAALNPFKYLEEEGQAQYLKGQKKLAAGADYLTLQIGFDAQKHMEALRWMRRQASPKPMLACVMALTYKRAQFLQKVPGVVITPSMIQLLAAEAQRGEFWARQRATDRLALQIIGMKHMGYAGIHLSGMHALAHFMQLEKRLEHWKIQIQNREQWECAWKELWQLDGIAPVVFHPSSASWYWGQDSVHASPQEVRRYQKALALHHRMFSQKTWISRYFAWCMHWKLWHCTYAARLLLWLERGLKKSTFGCDTCGTCRLDQTFYVCPETCPKGLANGPCGGTSLNRCEFGDRECIHNLKFRIAKEMGQTQELGSGVIPIAPDKKRHQSSWLHFFATRK